MSRRTSIMSSKSGGKAWWKSELLLLLLLLLTVGAQVRGEEEEEVTPKTGNFSQSRTNHETSSNSDFWVGSNKLDFKPHPLLMPAAALQRMPIPIIEMGGFHTSPLITPFSDMEEEVEGPKEEEEEDEEEIEKKKKLSKKRKSRGQRRLKTNNETAATEEDSPISGKNFLFKAFPGIQMPPGQQVLLTGPGSGGPVPPGLFPRHRTDESFHGSASSWNFNHPMNSLNGFAGGGVGVGGGGGGGLINPQQMQSPIFTSQMLQQLQLQQLMQQQQQQKQSQSQSPFGFPSGPGPEGPEMMLSQFSQQTTAPAAQNSNSGGPILVYVPPGGSPMTQVASASASRPRKTYGQSLSELPNIPVDFGAVKPMYGEPPSSPSSPPQYHHHPPHSHHHHHSSSQENPQYFRNNLLRVVMDKLAFIGKAMPIPFVTKFRIGKSHNQSPHSRYHQIESAAQQIYAGHANKRLSRRRMK